MRFIQGFCIELLLIWYLLYACLQHGIVQGGYALMRCFLRNGLNASGFWNMTSRLNVFQKFPQGRRRYQICVLLGFLALYYLLSFLRVFDFGNEQGYSKTRDLDGEKLLEQLPALQQLLHRLIGCKVLLWCHFPSRALCFVNPVLFSIKLEKLFLTYELTLLFRLFQPEGAAKHNHIIQYALSLVH